MRYEEIAPHEQLKAYIHSYFRLEVTRRKFQLPPDGCAILYFSYGDPLEMGFYGQRLQVIADCQIAGPCSRRFITRHSGQTALVAVRFRPGCLGRFFHVALKELTDTSVDPESLQAGIGRELKRRLFGVSDLTGIKQSLDDALLSIVSPTRCMDDAPLHAALSLIWNRKGQISVDTIAKRLSMNRRSLERRFLKLVGLSPKRMCRIARFSGVFSEASIANEPNWVELSYDYAYSDQSHLIRECKYFTGRSPIVYMQDRSSRSGGAMCVIEDI